MKPLGILLGVGAGVLGAAVWFAIAFYAHREVAYVAWGIGALVGFAVAVGSGSGGPVAGIAAALITIVSLLAGKYAAVEVGLQQALGEIDRAVLDENLVSYLADDVALEYEDAGRPVQWPDGAVPGEGWVETDYPADVWKEATRRWDAMSAAEQAEYRTVKTDEYNDGIDASLNTVRQAGFLGSFSPFDLLFFGLGVVTAFGIANNAEEA